MASVQLPDAVVEYKQATITCTDFSSRWDPHQVLSTLFKRGFGGAVIRKDSGTSILEESMIIEVAEEMNPGVRFFCHNFEPIEKDNLTSHPSQALIQPHTSTIDDLFDSASAYIFSRPQRVRKAVTGYFVILPNWNADSVYEHDEGKVVIEVHDPWSSRISTAQVPDLTEIRALERCVIIFEHSNHLLAEGNLAKELILLGFGKGRLHPVHSHPVHKRLGGEIIDWWYTSDFDFETNISRWREHGTRLLKQQSAITKSNGQLDEASSLHQRENPWDSTPFLASKHNGQELAPLAALTFGSPASFAYSFSMSPMSNFGSPASFMTASSPASFLTARSTKSSPAMTFMSGLSPAMRIATIREDEPCEPSMPPPLKKLRHEYYEHLHQQHIVQPFDAELNWSGKGQHVTFLPKDDVPLTVICNLGASAMAKVDKVLCRRIAIARKTMRCSRGWTIAEALREVYHLQNLSHPHIIQLVGTYLQGRNFSILMYPAADSHLGTFLEDTADHQEPASDCYARTRSFLLRSLSCLTEAVAYIHQNTTKHMDIKPQNILVRSWPQDSSPWRIYLADFGLSRSFASQDHSQTDGPTSRTPRYCAPEVFKYEKRGRSADVFSLGCVFLEILTVYYGKHPLDFSDFRRGTGNDESFHANLPNVKQWLHDLIGEDSSNPLQIAEEAGVFARIWLTEIERMLDEDPSKRPVAQSIQALTNHNVCCYRPPEPYVAYQASPPCPNPTAAPDPTMEQFLVRPTIELFELFEKDARMPSNSALLPPPTPLNERDTDTNARVDERAEQAGPKRTKYAAEND
jgi:serine/threonine protein kinase